MYENLALLIEQITKQVDVFADTDQSNWTALQHRLFDRMQSACQDVGKHLVELPTPAQTGGVITCNIHTLPTIVMILTVSISSAQRHFPNLSETQKNCLSEIERLVRQLWDAMDLMFKTLKKNLSVDENQS